MTSPPHTVLMFQTHLFDRGIARLFAKIRRDCPPHVSPVVLMHVPPGTPKPSRLREVPHHFVTTPEIRALPYPAKTATRDGRPWVLWEGGHCDLIPLHFYNAFPHFERYWVVEYDVRFTGNWSRLLGAFEDSPADFLSAALRRYDEHTAWECWDTLQAPPGQLPPAARRVRAFMPLYRVSRQGMAAVDEAYRAGWGGHLEAAWPTIIAARGMQLEDIGGSGAFVRPANIDRFYTCARRDVAGDTMAPGSLVAVPILYRPGSSPDRLYHPVKAFRFGPELRAVLRDLRTWQGRQRRALAAWAQARLRPARGPGGTADS